MRNKHWRIIVLALVLGFLSLALIGCSSGQSAASGGSVIKRSYKGTNDPCQRTILDLKAKSGVDLRAQGQRVVDGFERYQAIADVTLYPNTSRLEVTWCNSMQTENGLIRAVTQTNLVTVERVTTSPNTAR